MFIYKLATFFVLNIALSDALSLGVPSYWDANPSLYRQIPSGSIAIINPDDGIPIPATESAVVDRETAAFAAIVTEMTKRNVTVIGYVATGYFDHRPNVAGAQTWQQIEAQVARYFKVMPDLAGIFFDETSPSNWSCSGFGAEYERLRNIAKKHKAKARVAFNPGLWDRCMVDAVKSGETVILYEGPSAGYMQSHPDSKELENSTRYAKTKGILTWHIIHTATQARTMQAVVRRARFLTAEYVYVTDVGGDWQNGDNTYGKPPIYWAAERRAVLGV